MTTIDTLRAAKIAADTAKIAFNFVDDRAPGFDRAAHAAGRRAAAQAAYEATEALNAALAAGPRVEPTQAERDAFEALSSESVARQSAAFHARRVAGEGDHADAHSAHCEGSDDVEHV